MIYRTEHGNNIADQIQTEDAHGDFDTLNAADIWWIIDNIDTHLMDNGQENSPLRTMLLELNNRIVNTYPEIEV